MAYTKQNFKNGDVLTAENLILMEDGIVAIEQEHPILTGSGEYSVIQKGNEGQAVATFSTAFGKDTYTGTRGYRIQSIDSSSNTATLTTTPDTAILNATYSIYLKYSADRFGTVTAIDGNTITIENLNQLMTDAGWDEVPTTSTKDTDGNYTVYGQDYYYENSYIFFDELPALGDILIGTAAHAEGYGTKALAIGSHSEGYNNTSVGKYSHTEGRDTLAYYAAHAEGYLSEAKGEASHAENRSVAHANYSHAEGYETNATAQYSHSEGYRTNSQGSKSHAEGYNSSTGVDAEAAHAEGYASRADSFASHAEGFGTTASGEGAHAEGRQTIASADQSHAEGKETTALGIASHVEGYKSKASGNYSHAEGYNTEAGLYSHAEGFGAKATGERAHAEGEGTTASGKRSHAEGYQTVASAPHSHAAGNGTIASTENQTVVGRHNIEDSNAYFIVGNGNATTRSNAFTSNKNGTATVGADPVNAMDVATKQYVDNLKIIDSELSSESENLVQNKVVTNRINEVAQMASDAQGSADLAQQTADNANAVVETLTETVNELVVRMDNYHPAPIAISLVPYMTHDGNTDDIDVLLENAIKYHIEGNYRSIEGDLGGLPGELWQAIDLSFDFMPDNQITYNATYNVNDASSGNISNFMASFSTYASEEILSNYELIDYSASRGLVNLDYVLDDMSYADVAIEATFTFNVNSEYGTNEETVTVDIPIWACYMNGDKLEGGLSVIEAYIEKNAETEKFFPSTMDLRTQAIDNRLLALMQEFQENKRNTNN